MCRFAALVGEFDSNGKRVGGDREGRIDEGVDQCGDGRVRNQDIEIPVLACGVTDQSVDSPPARDHRGDCQPVHHVEQPDDVVLRRGHQRHPRLTRNSDSSISEGLFNTPGNPSHTSADTAFAVVTSCSSPAPFNMA